jgi:surfeit locus 1 family protein
LTDRPTARSPDRFPFGLTIAAAIAFVILIALGVWQLERLKQTNANRASVAALSQTPARPLDAVLAEPEHADHARVDIACRPGPAPTAYRYALPGGGVGWRLLTLCHVDRGVFDGVLLDRGLVARLSGMMEPVAFAFPAPGRVVGVLRKLGAKPMFSDAMSARGAATPTVRVIDPAAVAKIAALSGSKRPAPWYVVVERETPSVAGVEPTPVTEDTPRDNFGYALTWFGLALALAGVYGAFVWRRMRAI